MFSVRPTSTSPWSILDRTNMLLSVYRQWSMPAMIKKNWYSIIHEFIRFPKTHISWHLTKQLIQTITSFSLWKEDYVKIMTKKKRAVLVSFIDKLCASTVNNLYCLAECMWVSLLCLPSDDGFCSAVLFILMNFSVSAKGVVRFAEGYLEVNSWLYRSWKWRFFVFVFF